MKITREPVQADPGLAPLALPEPEPAPPTPAQIEERQAADRAALEGTRRLAAELQGRLASVTAQAHDHRQCASQPFAGQPGELVAHLATTEQHRADADRLATEAESLKRQCAVAAALLGKLEADATAAHEALAQSHGRKLLARALERYTGAVVALADVIVEVGGAAILANQPSSFVAATRSLCIPDLAALGKTLPDLAGFRKQREGQTVNQGDPAYQQRANELLRHASS